MSKKTVETAPKARKRRAAPAKPTQEEIALRAYHIYLQRNGAPGNPFEDWTRAEQELNEEAAKPKKRGKNKVVSIAA
jgi:Protein of unknown function (DUF2934)